MRVSPLFLAVCSIDLVQLLLAVLGQIRQAADRLEPNIFFHQLRRFLLQETFEQPHQREDFGLRPLPVFGRKGVEREVLDLQARRSLRRMRAPLRRPVSCPLIRGKPRVLRPATVAIHDDGDVARNRFARRRP